MGELAKFVTAYKEQPPEIRKNIRRKAAYLSESPARQMHERQFNGELLKAFEQAEKEIAPAPPVQTVKIELPDISGRTVVKLGKIAGVGAVVYVGFYAIGAAAVGIAASIAAFFAAWGVWMVGAGVGLIALKCVDWRAVFGRGEGGETAERPTLNRQNITINVTASNGGNVTVTRDEK